MTQLIDMVSLKQPLKNTSPDSTLANLRMQGEGRYRPQAKP